MLPDELLEDAEFAADESEALNCGTYKASSRGRSVGCTLPKVGADDAGIEPGTDLKILYHPSEQAFIVKRADA